MNIKKVIVMLVFAVAIIGIISPVNAVDTVEIESKNKKVAKSYEDQILDLVNEERSKLDIPPLKMDKDLFKAAKIRVKEQKKLFGHVRPDGTFFTTVSPKANGENCAGGYKTPKQVMKDWMNSISHKVNILNPDYKSIGIGYLGGKHPYWVQLFGRERKYPNKWEKYDSGKFEVKNKNSKFKKEFQPYLYYTAYMKKDNQLYVNYYYKTKKTNQNVIAEKVSFTKNKNDYTEMKYIDYIKNIIHPTRKEYREDITVEEEYMLLKRSVKKDIAKQNRL